MRTVMMHVSDEFHEMLAMNMIGDDVLIYGMDFYLDSFHTEGHWERYKGIEVPVLVCNAAFRAMTVGKGRQATIQIETSDKLRDKLKEEARKSPGWTFSEMPGLSFMNRNGEVVPTNEEARRALRSRTFHEIFLDLPKHSLTQTDYEEAELYFETRQGVNPTKSVLPTS